MNGASQETGPERTGEALSPKRRAPKLPQVPPRAGDPPSAADAEQRAGAAPAQGEAPEVSVIVPVTTGDGRVADVVQALGSELVRLGRSHEFVLVFDGVRGRAWAEASELVRRESRRVVAIALDQPMGESLCLSAGLQRARGRIVVTSPQYVQIDPFELAPMLAALEAGADLVAPWRHPRIDPWLNRVQSSLFNALMRRILHADFHDLNCYFRAFRRQVLDDVPIHGDLYRFLPAIAARAGFKVVEVRVRHLKEWGERGFFGIGVYVRRMLDILGVVFLSKFVHKPLRFFGSIGGALLLLGALLCLTVALQSIWFGGPVLTRSVFLFGVLMVVLGVQVIGFGLVGEILIYTQARNLRSWRVERVWERPDDPGDRDLGPHGGR